MVSKAESEAQKCQSITYLCYWLPLIFFWEKRLRQLLYFVVWFSRLDAFEMKGLGKILRVSWTAQKQLNVFWFWWARPDFDADRIISRFNYTDSRTSSNLETTPTRPDRLAEFGLNRTTAWRRLPNDVTCRDFTISFANRGQQSFACCLKLSYC